MCSTKILIMEAIKVKVCGMTDRENLAGICTVRPDLVGFIFYPGSPRFVGDDPDPALFSVVPNAIGKVGVFVNAPYDAMVHAGEKYGLGTLQLHGMESPEQCNALRRKGFTVIKAIPGEQLGNSELLNDYRYVADYLLLDSSGKQFGGTGKKFNWDPIRETQFGLPFFLSGGIGPDDAHELREAGFPQMAGVDVNSRFETEPGIKDVSKVVSFINTLRDEG